MPSLPCSAFIVLYKARKLLPSSFKYPTLPISALCKHTELILSQEEQETTYPKMWCGVCHGHSSENGCSGGATSYCFAWVVINNTEIIVCLLDNGQHTKTQANNRNGRKYDKELTAKWTCQVKFTDNTKTLKKVSFSSTGVSAIWATLLFMGRSQGQCAQNTLNAQELGRIQQFWERLTVLK